VRKSISLGSRAHHGWGVGVGVRIDDEGPWIHPPKKGHTRGLARYNITEKLPGSMTEAIQACKDDEMFRKKVWRGVHAQIDQPENMGREFAAQDK